jgi:4-alpha-glucanotransferase
MIETSLESLAAMAGLATEWTDFRGDLHVVSSEVLRAILAAMDLPAATADEIGDSRRRLAATHAGAERPLITCDAGGQVVVGDQPGLARLTLESGACHDVKLVPNDHGLLALHAPDEPGYHALEIDGRQVTLAVAPPRGWIVDDVAPGRRLAGLALQLYSLRDAETQGFGDFTALARLATRLAGSHIDALAISPTHALFAADPGRYGPYAPSTRLFHNVLYADPGDHAARMPDGGDLVDWGVAGANRLTALRAAYERFRQTGDQRAAFAGFVAKGGERLLNHARFEALDGRFRPQGLYHWRHWPAGFADVYGLATQALSADLPEVEFHLYLQFLADQGLANAQRAAREAGMAIGLIADLAVGMDGAGSHAWSRPNDVLTGVSVGAPPDPLGPDGQNWGLTSFSPHGLIASGFDAFLSTMRAALRNAGGVRIDHAMGLRRLWVVPDGARAGEGTYISYPFADLLRLTALESWRHKAVIIGEDLGTVPPGFRETTTAAGILGMRVLWFERAEQNRFRPPSWWDERALALTTTHDLPTVAGWWRGRDIDWRQSVTGDIDRAQNARWERQEDRVGLWSLLRDTGNADGEMPAPDDTARVVDGAIAAVAGTPCDLAIIPAEDVLGLVEQPNLPGTIDEHPNWRRRLPPTDALVEGEGARRLEILHRNRS